MRAQTFSESVLYFPIYDIFVKKIVIEKEARDLDTCQMIRY
jgi:hypothetical protein